MNAPRSAPHVAIACGGTGGHLFPGIAVGLELVRRGCEVTLFVSPKEVDQQAVRALTGMKVVTLPAVGLVRGGGWGFLRGFVKSFLAARACYRQARPVAVLSMGGFTGAPPVLAGRLCGAKAFLHDSNTIPGKANLLLARFVHEAFVYFPETIRRLGARSTRVVGMPVRPAFQPADPAAARAALGLDPAAPTLLIMGGSQGASGINDLALAALPDLVRRMPSLQFIHLTGPNDLEKVRAAYAALGRKAWIEAFSARMEQLLGASTAALSRAGASSLAELAAMRVPAVLIPYPHAAEDHQMANARAFAEEGAAHVLGQKAATAATLCEAVCGLLAEGARRQQALAALARWNTPQASTLMAERMLQVLNIRTESAVPAGSSPACPEGGAR